GRVSLGNVNGDIRITGWDRNEVKLDAIKHASDREVLKETEIKVETTADHIRIWTRPAGQDYPDHRNRRDDISFAKVDYTLMVPRGASLESIALVNGSLEISGVQGDAKISTVTGRVKAQGLAGELRVSTVSGAVEAAFDRLEASKPLRFSSVSGA